VRDAGNVLRPFTTLRLSLRVPPSADATSVAGELAEVLNADPPDGAKVTVEVETPADGWTAPEPAPWVADALDRASQRCFGAPPGAYGEGGTIPFLAELGQRYPDAQLVATGVLGPHSNAHGPNEFLHLPMAQAVTLAVAELIAAAAVPG
jgi:acetylornithine deacetylase/succinyl-diaminopimelate desuccinylase-like protein